MAIAEIATDWAAEAFRSYGLPGGLFVTAVLIARSWFLRFVDWAKPHAESVIASHVHRQAATAQALKDLAAGTIEIQNKVMKRVEEIADNLPICMAEVMTSNGHAPKRETGRVVVTPRKT